MDPDWSEEERGAVAQYWSRGTTARVFLGWSYCRLCGAQNGDSEFTDGLFIWPEGLAHYVTNHDVRPPREFTDHAIARMDDLEGAEVDDLWWQGAGPDSRR